MHKLQRPSRTPALPSLAILRRTATLPELFERAAAVFQEASGAEYCLLYLVVTGEEAIELSFAGTPPSRCRDLPWNGSVDPLQDPWRSLGASEVHGIFLNHAPFALIVLGPRGNSAPARLEKLCATLAETTEQRLLRTRAMAADFQEQRANQLRRQTQSLQRRLQQVSHDMRNHLVPMLYATEDLQELLSAPEALHLTLTIERQIQLADQLSKHTMATLQPKTGRADLTAVARQEAEGWQRVFSRRQQAFDLHLPEAPLWVSGHASQLHQVLGNLLSNAHKFTPPGGRITLAASSQGERCLLEVSDSGRGIGPTIRRRLFEATVREDATLDGNGFGLSNIQAVLRTLGGSIEVQSQQNQGSRFRVWLPRS